MDSCPSDDELTRFLAGEDADAIGLHVRRCGRCQQVLERLSDDDALRLAAVAPGRSAWDWGDTTKLVPIVEALRGMELTRSRRELSASTPLRPFELDPPRVAGAVGSLGPYDIEDEVGRGGMGIVYRARDRTTGRLVALKVLFAGNDDERLRRRFVQEVRAAARVDHDHIVRLYTTSDPSDRTPYFVMEYVAGPSLAELISGRGRIPPREAAELVAQAATGVQAAHAAGLIHSDIKPANILIDPATRRAKVGDFGLARLETETSGLSREGVLPGTPAYFSPEQARGETRPVPSSDIYSLGVTLYECLAGETPFLGKPHRIIHQVLNDEPRPPRVLNAAIPADLETICLKAMAKDPSRRYVTPADLAADLRRFLNGEPILARPAGTLERGWRWCRKNRRVASLIAIVGLLLATLTAGSIVAAVSIDRARSRAVASAHRADVQRGIAVDALSSLVQGIQDQLATRPGTLELRRSLLEIARAGLSKIPSSESGGIDGGVDDRAIQALIRLGDIDIILGRAAEARSEFERAAEMAEHLSRNNSKSAEIRRALANAYDRAADMVTGLNYTKVLAEEVKYREEAIAIRRALLAEQPENPVYRRDLMVSRNRVATIRLKTGQIAEAAKLFEDSLASLKAEPVDEKNRTQILSDLRWIYSRIAYCAGLQGRVPVALAMYRESLGCARDLCAIDPQNPSYRRQLAAAHDYLGLTCLTFGDLQGAEENLIAFRDNRQAAVAADPADLDVRRSLGLAHQGLGDLAARRRDFGAARASYREAMDHLDEVARRDPTAVRAHRDRTIVRRMLVLLEAEAGRNAEAAAWAERELEVGTAPGVPAYPDHDAELAEARQLRDVYRMVDRCIDNPALARSQPPKLGAGLLSVRAVILARAGRTAEALEAASELLSLKDAPNAPLFAARACALAAAQPTRSRPETRAECVQTAIRALRQAVTNATVRPTLLPFDPEFAPLRDHPDFIALTRSSMDRPVPESTEIVP